MITGANTQLKLKVQKRMETELKRLYELQYDDNFEPEVDSITKQEPR